MRKINNSEFLTNNDKIKFEELAESVSESSSSRTVVDLEEIASRNGLTYSYGSYKDAFDGLLEHRNGRFHIYINTDRLGHAYTERARFTFAHELGHYFIDSHRNALAQGLAPSHPSFTGFKSENLVERQADFFASCLLLPKARITKACQNRRFDFILIQELSKKYQVSLTATALRYTTLKFHPILVVCAIGSKIKWYWYTSDFPFKALKHGKDKIPHNTVAGEYIYSLNKYTSNEVVYAKDWFRVNYKEDMERKFYERCVCGNNKVLSIIWED